MVHRDHLFGVVLVFEHEREDHGHHEGVACEDVPRIGPTPRIDDGACGVHIVFDHKVILGTRARKMRTKSYNAFSSIDYPETAILRGRQVVYYIPEHVTGAPEFYDRLDPGVFVLKLIPGIDAGIFDYLKAHYRALVIESFGVGGLPCYGDESFYHAVRDWVQSGRVIVMTTQVPHEGSDMEVYQVGHRAKRELGLIEAYLSLIHISEPTRP